MPFYEFDYVRWNDGEGDNEKCIVETMNPLTTHDIDIIKLVNSRAEPSDVSMDWNIKDTITKLGYAIKNSEFKIEQKIDLIPNTIRNTKDLCNMLASM